MERLNFDVIEASLPEVLGRSGYRLLGVDQQSITHRLDFCKPQFILQSYPRYHMVVRFRQDIALAAVNMHYDIAPHKSWNNQFRDSQKILRGEIKVLADSLESAETPAARFLLEKLRDPEAVLVARRHLRIPDSLKDKPNDSKPSKKPHKSKKIYKWGERELLRELEELEEGEGFETREWDDNEQSL